MLLLELRYHFSQIESGWMLLPLFVETDAHFEEMVVREAATLQRLDHRLLLGPVGIQPHLHRTYRLSHLRAS